jgi:hypothetical protein
MINMGQDTPGKDMEKHLRAMLSAWIKGTGGIKITPKGGRWLSPWGRIDTSVTPQVLLSSPKLSQICAMNTTVSPYPNYTTCGR